MSLGLFSDCPWDSSRNNILWHVLLGPTGWQQNIFYASKRLGVIFKKHTRRQVENHFMKCTPVVFPRCTRNGIRKQFFIMTCPWAYFHNAHETAAEITFHHMLSEAIPRVPTTWRLRMLVCDDKHQPVSPKKLTRWQQRRTFHTHSGVIHKMHSEMGLKANFRDGIYTGFIHNMTTRWPQKINFYDQWYIIVILNAHGMAT